MAAHAVDLARRAAQIKGRAQSQSLVAVELQVTLGADRRQPADRQTGRAAAQLQPSIRPACLVDPQCRATCAIDRKCQPAERGEGAAKLERRRRGQCDGGGELLIQLGQPPAPGLIAAVAEPAFDARPRIEMPRARGGLDRQRMIHGIAFELDLQQLDRFAGHHQTLGLEIDAQLTGGQLRRARRQAWYADATEHRQQHIKPCQLDMRDCRAGLCGAVDLELTAGERERHPRRGKPIAQLPGDAQMAAEPLVELGELAGIERQLEPVGRRTEIAFGAQSGRPELHLESDLAQPIRLVAARHRPGERKPVEAAVCQRQADQRRHLRSGDTRCRESAIDQSLGQIGEARRIEAGQRAFQIESVGLGHAGGAAQLGNAIAGLQRRLGDAEHLTLEPCLRAQRDVAIGQCHIEGQTFAGRLERHRSAQGGLAQRAHHPTEVERFGAQAQREIGNCGRLG